MLEVLAWLNQLLTALVAKGTLEYQWAYLKLVTAGRPLWENILFVALLVVGGPGFVVMLALTALNVTGSLMEGRD